MISEKKIYFDLGVNNTNVTSEYRMVGYETIFVLEEKAAKYVFRQNAR